MSEYGKTNKKIGILIAVLFIATIIGWSAFAGQQDIIKEYQDEIEDLEAEIDDLREQVYWVSDERDQLAQELRVIYQKPLGLSGVIPTRSRSVADMMRDSQFWNMILGEEELRQQDIDESYQKTLTFEIMMMGVGLYEWDNVAEIASAWESLDAKDIASVIVVGNPHLKNETFAESDRIWLLVFWTKRTVNSGTGWSIIVDPITGKKQIAYPIIQDSNTTDGLSVLPEDLIRYFEGYAYTSPADLVADIEGR